MNMRRHKAKFAGMTIVAAAAVGLAVVPTSSAAPPHEVFGRYIVVLDESVANPGAVAAEHARQHSASVNQVWGAALKGYAVSMPAGRAAALRNDPRVALVEEDGEAFASATQSSATWGLDRIDQRNLPLSTTYSYDSTGAGVTAYVIDTGIAIQHAEFGGRARSGYDFIGDDSDASDCNGHGTHVAGTIGGSTYGVAKAVSLVGVRVLDCNGSGSWSQVISGINWVAANAQKPAVANMSLGGGASSSVDAAVRGAISRGVTFAIAAGNGNFVGIAQDACKSSPARVTEAITVSATTSSDTKASFANYGNCVDLFAPGVSITSAWYNNTTATNTISGTSMATPHVAGAAARYLQANATATPAQVRDALFSQSTKSIVKSSKTANNHLLYLSA